MLKFNRLSVALGAIVAAAMAAPAAAQDETAAEEQEFLFDRITVTAQKREQDVLDVPLALTAITGEFLQDQGITELDDLSDYVPGFQLQLQSVGTPSFVIRGITSDVSEPEAEPNISVFFDGIPASRGPGAIIELFDLERVEVAKGPQGTLFSRGASNGAVNFIFAKPDATEFGGYAKVEFGNHSSERYEGVVNAPIVEDVLAVRLGAVFAQRDGYIGNVLEPGGHLSGKDTLHLRGSVGFTPTDNFDLTVLSFYQYDSPDPTGYRTLVPSLAEADPFLRGSIDPFSEQYAQNPDDFQKREVYGVTAIANYDFGEGFSITSTSGFRQFQAQDSFDPDGSAIPVWQGNEDDDGTVIFQELRGTFAVGERFTGFAGASYYFEDANRIRTFDINQDLVFAAVLPLLAGPGAVIPIGGLPTVTEELDLGAETESYSFFIDGTFDITDTLAFTAGVRYTHDDKSQTFTGQTTTSEIAPGISVPGSLLPLALTDFGALGAFAAGDPFALGRFVDSIPTNPFSPGNPVLLGALAEGFGLDFTDPFLLALLTPEQQARLGQIETNALEGTTGGQTLTAGDTFDYFEPRFVLEWRFDEEWLAYASYSWGIRSGGVEIDPRAGLTEAEYSRTVTEEKVTSYEIGLKGRHAFDIANVTFEGALYYYDYEDFQTLVVSGGALQSVNAGTADALGAELSTLWDFKNGFTAFGNVGYIDGGIEDGLTTSLLGDVVDLSGNQFRLTPKYTVSGGISYEQSLMGEMDVFGSLLATYKSSHFFNAENEQATETVPVDLASEGYTVVTLNLGVKVDDNWELRGRVENLFDQQYLIDAGNTGRIIGIPTAFRGEPRLWTIGFPKQF